MRCDVVVRHDNGLCTVALKLSRSAQGHISCVETVPAAFARPGLPAPGMTWWTDGRYRLTSPSGSRLKSQRLPLHRLRLPQFAYHVTGEFLVRPDLPEFAADQQEESVELALDTLLDAPYQQELHLILVPNGSELPLPHDDAELLGQWRVLDGAPAAWIALYDVGESAA